MKKIFVLFGIVFMLFSQTKASTVVDSIQKTTTSLKVFYHWDFNAPDSTGKVGVQIATNAGFTTGVFSDAFPFTTVDTGHSSYTFTSLTPNTQYWVRAREFTCLSCIELYSSTITVMTSQIYYSPQVMIDSVSSTTNSQTVFYRYKCGNDTVRIKFQFAENSLTSGPFYVIPDFYYGTYNTNTWLTGQFTKAGLSDTTYHEVSATAYNRAGNATDVDGAYTLSVPSGTTPFVLTDSSTTTVTTATMYGHGYTTGTYGFRVYGSAADAAADNAGINYTGSGPISGFSKTISGFTPGVTRWFRAYVSDGSGTILGSVKSFTTSIVPVPIISLTMVATGTTTATGSAVVTTTYAANVVLRYNGNQSLLSSGTTLTGTNLPISLTGLNPGTTNYYYVGVSMFPGDTTWKIGNVVTDPLPAAVPFQGDIVNLFLDDYYYPLDSASFQVEWKGTNTVFWIDIQEYNKPSTIRSGATISGLTSISGGTGFSYRYVDLYGMPLDELLYQVRVVGYSSDGGAMHQSPWHLYDLRPNGVNDIVGKTARVYPTVTNDLVTVSLQKETEVKLFSTTGSLLETKTGTEITFDISTFPSGMYLMQIGKNTIKEIIKQ